MMVSLVPICIIAMSLMVAGLRRPPSANHVIVVALFDFGMGTRWGADLGVLAGESEGGKKTKKLEFIL